MKTPDTPIIRKTKLRHPGGLTRRTAIKSAGALALSAGVLSVMPTGLAEAAAPKKGGMFRVALGQGHTTDNLDPTVIWTNFQMVLQYTVRNYLVEIDQNNELIGELAESWDHSPDAKTWAFKIRKGVEFHNGKSLTPADIVASINTHRTEDTKSGAKSLMSSVEDITTDGDLVIFHLTSPNVDFPYYLYHFQLAILPSDGEGNVDWESGNGTGGYVLESFQPGVSAIAKRNKNYWKSGAAHFDEVEILAIRDAAARANAMAAGEIDAMDECDPKIADRFSQLEGITVEEALGIETQLCPMDTTISPFNDNNVRMALKLAMDRETYVKLILRGHGVVGNDHLVAPFMPYHASEIPQRAYDPEKAKWHLKQAGQDSLKLQLHAADIFPGATDAAVVYKEFAAKAGIEIEVVKETSDAFWSSVWMVKPWVVSNWSARPIPDMIFSDALKCGAEWNETRMCHDRLENLMVAARKELDATKRREMWVEMQTIVRDEGGSVVPAFNNLIFARSTKVQRGSGLTNNYALDGNRATERWWFA